MIKDVGKYNISFEGEKYDNDKNIPYEMVIIEAFDGDDKSIRGSKKVLYFRKNTKNEKKY